MSHSIRRVRANALTGPRSILVSDPFTGVVVHPHAGHLLIELQSVEASVRLQLTRRDLPMMLKTLIDAVSQLAAVSK